MVNPWSLWRRSSSGLAACVLLSTVAIIGVPTGLILLQPDFGTAMLVAASGVFALYLAGLSAWWFVISAWTISSSAGPSMIWSSL